jgi:hypothetical protein
LDIKSAFPIPYAHWYAANLFMDAGHPPQEVLSRLGIEVAIFGTCNERYRLLNFANMSWVASSYQRDGLSPPGEDKELYFHLLEGSEVAPPVVEPFDMRSQLKTLREIVQARPQIGPFADCDWTAVYLCERGFPTSRYVHDGHYVKVGGLSLTDRNKKRLEGIDPFTFRKIGERWFRDERRVYGQAETPTRIYWFVARGADPDSFVVLNERYAKDKSAGYYITNRRFPSEEPETFQVVGYYYGRGQKPGFHVEESHFAKDSRKVYAYGVDVAGAHAPSFVSLGDEGVYFADDNRVYWQGKPMPEADRASFVCASEVGQYRAYDKHRPYEAGQAMSISKDFKNWTGYFEARPEIADIWWHREKQRRENSATNEKSAELAPLGGPYFTDGTRVLVKSRNTRHGMLSLDNIDLASFRHIVDVFGSDQSGLRYVVPDYEAYGRNPIKGGDPGSFLGLGDGWYRDAKQAYYLNVDADFCEFRIVKADMVSFELLGGAYARDAGGLIVEGVRKRDIKDPASVVALGHLFARMGETLLYRGKPVKKPGKIDPMTARGVHDYLLIDASGHMLLRGLYRKPVPGVVPSDLRFLNFIFAYDGQRVYGLSPEAFAVCNEIDYKRSIVDGRYAMIVGNDCFTFHDKTLRRAARQSALMSSPDADPGPSSLEES